MPRPTLLPQSLSMDWQLPWTRPNWDETTPPSRKWRPVWWRENSTLEVFLPGLEPRNPGSPDPQSQQGSLTEQIAANLLLWQQWDWFLSTRNLHKSHWYSNWLLSLFSKDRYTPVQKHSLTSFWLSVHLLAAKKAICLELLKAEKPEGSRGNNWNYCLHKTWPSFTQITV